MNIGTTIYKLRTAQNMSQEELAERLDVSRQSVSKWETDASVPDLDKLVKLCEIFEVSLDELVGREAPKSKTEESPPPQVIVQQAPAKDSFFTNNKIYGCLLLLAAVLVTFLADSFRVVVMSSLPLYFMGMYYLTEQRNQWLGYAFWIYFEKMYEIRYLIELWNKTESAAWKMALLPIVFVVFVATCIVWVRFYRNRVTFATIAPKYDRAILVALGWLVHFACIVLYALHVAGVIAISGQYTWLLLSLYSCLGMVYYTTTVLVYRKNK